MGNPTWGEGGCKNLGRSRKKMDQKLISQRASIIFYIIALNSRLFGAFIVLLRRGNNSNQLFNTLLILKTSRPSQEHFNQTQLSLNDPQNFGCPKTSFVFGKSHRFQGQQIHNVQSLKVQVYKHLREKWNNVQILKVQVSKHLRKVLENLHLQNLHIIRKLIWL